MKVLLYFVFEQHLARISINFNSLKWVFFEHTREANGEPNIITVANAATRPA